MYQCVVHPIAPLVIIFTFLVASVYNYDISQVLPPRNYAAIECARVLQTNPEATNALHIISRGEDDYMLNICGAKKWFVIELCEPIEATQIAMANYELFSSTFENFTVYFSDVYPTTDGWKTVGRFTADNTRSIQTFDLRRVGFGRFIRVDFHSHHRDEFYCPISEVRVYGISMIDKYEMEKSLSKYKIARKKSVTKVPALDPYSSVMLQSHWNVSHLHNHTSFRLPKKSGLNMEKPAVNKTPHLAGGASITTSPEPSAAADESRLRPSVFDDIRSEMKLLKTYIKKEIDGMGKRINENDNTNEDRSRREVIIIKMAIVTFGVYRLVLYLLSRD